VYIPFLPEKVESSKLLNHSHMVLCPLRIIELKFDKEWLSFQV